MAPSDRKVLESRIVSALAETLGLDAAAIDAAERFSHYGLTSLTAAALVARLEEMLARPLAPTLVWDHPSPARAAVSEVRP